ncbi:MAG: hypothetical protein RL291_1863, partial [Pseudomonadota bacterium]
MSNYPEPTNATPIPPTYQPRDLIPTYREIVGMPFGDRSPQPPSDYGTVAHARIDNQDVYGVNSGSPAYTQRDDALARDIRDRLIAERPDLMNTINIGLMPND